MDITTAKLTRDLAKTLLDGQREKTTPYDTTGVVRRIEDDIAWVSIPGGVDETPVELTMNAKVDDYVQIRVSGGRAWITGNGTSPPTDDERADEAYQVASDASEAAATAEQAAAEAIGYSEEAKSAAERARETAEGIEGIALIAKDASDKAMKGLSQVEDVVGTLDWITSHSKETEDQIPDPDKKYYIKNPDGTFTLVTDTEGKNPAQEGWWEMDEAIQNYILSHLALLDDGLYVQKEGSDWKVRIAHDGIYIVNPEDDTVASYKDIITLGKDDGSQSAQILDYHSLRLFDKENMALYIDPETTDEAVAYFHVSDLRDINNVNTIYETHNNFEITSKYTITNSNLLPSTKLDDIRSVKIEGVEYFNSQHIKEAYVERLKDENGAYSKYFKVSVFFNEPFENSETLKFKLYTTNEEIYDTTYTINVEAGDSNFKTIVESEIIYIWRIRVNVWDFNNMPFLTIMPRYNYRTTSDTTPIEGKTYFYGSIVTDFYYVEDVVGKNPYEEGWWERLEEFSIIYLSGSIIGESGYINYEIIYESKDQRNKAFSFGKRKSDLPIGYSSSVLGWDCAAVGGYSIAMGSGNSAYGISSLAEGVGNTAYNTGSHVEGYSNSSRGNYAHVEGSNNNVYNSYSHTEGTYNTNNSYASHIEGASNTASNRGSWNHVEGVSNICDGQTSHIEGEDNIISITAHACHAEGYNTKINEYVRYAHVQNYGTIASKDSQTVIGKFNIEDTEEYDKDKQLAIIIGNGKTDEYRSNALEVTWDGCCKLYPVNNALTAPSAPITVIGNIPRGGAPTTTEWKTVMILKDTNLKRMGQIDHIHDTVSNKDNETFRFAKIRQVNGEDKFNAIQLSIDEDGTRRVKVSDESAWRTAIGLSNLMVKEAKALGSVEIPASGVRSVSANVAKSGYTPIGIVGITKTGSNNGDAVVSTFNVSGNIATVSLRNQGSAARTPSVTADVLYLKNL